MPDDPTSPASPIPTPALPVDLLPPADDHRLHTG